MEYYDGTANTYKTSTKRGTTHPKPELTFCHNASMALASRAAWSSKKSTANNQYERPEPIPTIKMNQPKNNIISEGNPELRRH